METQFRPERLLYKLTVFSTGPAGVTIPASTRSNTTRRKGHTIKEAKNVRVPSGQRQRGRSEAYQVGRLGIFVLIIILLVIVVLRLLDLL